MKIAALGRVSQALTSASLATSYFLWYDIWNHINWFGDLEGANLLAQRSLLHQGVRLQFGHASLTCTVRQSLDVGSDDLIE